MDGFIQEIQPKQMKKDILHMWKKEKCNCIKNGKNIFPEEMENLVNKIRRSKRIIYLW